MTKENIYLSFGDGSRINSGEKVIRRIEDLLFLMRNEPDELDRIKVDFADIQSFLAGQVGAKIPVRFSEDLGFNGRLWQLVYSPYKPDALPYLFLGIDSYLKDSTDLIEYDDALSTVHLSRRTYESNRVSPFTEIRVAGVHRDLG